MIPVFPGRATCSMALWTSCIWVSQHPGATEHCGPLHLSTVTKAHASPTSRRHARHLRPSPLTTRGTLTSARPCAPLLSCHGGLLLCLSHCSRPTTPLRDGHHMCAAAAPRRARAARGVHADDARADGGSFQPATKAVGTCSRPSTRSVRSWRRPAAMPGCPRRPGLMPCAAGAAPCPLSPS